MYGAVDMSSTAETKTFAMKAYGSKGGVEKYETFHSSHIYCWIKNPHGWCQNISGIEEKNLLELYMRFSVFMAVKIWFVVGPGTWLPAFRRKYYPQLYFYLEMKVTINQITSYRNTGNHNLDSTKQRNIGGHRLLLHYKTIIGAGIHTTDGENWRAERI
jgi:hypothetical protein